VRVCSRRFCRVSGGKRTSSAIRQASPQSGQACPIRPASLPGVLTNNCAQAIAASRHMIGLISTLAFRRIDNEAPLNSMAALKVGGSEDRQDRQG
jgi:hypothetical protein